MVHLMMLLASHDTKVSANGHYLTEKSHIAPHFSYLDLRNGMVPLTM